jgi:hypothetical protein
MTDPRPLPAFSRPSLMADLRWWADWLTTATPGNPQEAGLTHVLQLAAETLTQAEAQIAALIAERECAHAQLRGMRDFLSGQPRDLPRDWAPGEAKESQLGFWWTVGYDTASEGDLFREMVRRADKYANQADAAEAQIAALTKARDFQLWRADQRVFYYERLWARTEAQIAALIAERDRIEEVFREGMHTPDLPTADAGTCPYAADTREAHWWTRGFAYQARNLRAITAEARADAAEAALRTLQQQIEEPPR